VTENSPSSSEPVATSADPAASPSTAGAASTGPAPDSTPPATGATRTAARTRAGRAPAATRPARHAALVPAAKAAPVPAYRHPNLGLAPIDTTAAFPAAAATLRGNAARISAAALKAILEADPEIRTRHGETGLRHLLRDGELLVERLALCLGSGNDTWLVEYAEWVGPTYRRRRVPQADLAALCGAIGETIAPDLSPDELTSATRSLGAAAAVFRGNGRVGGDTHKRNALLKWMYRGV
jgi:hypothetical protein